MPLSRLRDHAASRTDLPMCASDDRGPHRIGVPACHARSMGEFATHKVERWEYDLGGELIAAIWSDDRDAFDARLAASDGDRMEIHADLIGLALRVAEVARHPHVLIRIRPSRAAREAVVQTLASSTFADLIDTDMAAMLRDGLYQRPSGSRCRSRLTWCL